MNPKRAILPFLAILPLLSPVCLNAVEQPPLFIDSLSITGTTRALKFEPLPSIQSYTFFSGTNPGALTINTNFFQAPYITSFLTNKVSGTNQVITNVAYEWRLTNVTAPRGFYRVGATPMNPNALLAANVLNRLAYGPTPDELERVTSIGAQAYIDEQLNMNGVPDTLDNSAVEIVNSGIAFDTSTNWVFVNTTGTLASTAISLFSTQPGEGYFDDVEIRPYRYSLVMTTNFSGTNITGYSSNRVISYIGPNVLTNGDFETGFAPWQSTGGATGSAVDSSRAHSGSSSLRFTSSSSASAPGSSYVRNSFVNAPYMTTNTWGDTFPITNASAALVLVNYWYQPTTTSTNLRVQFGSGVNLTPAGIAPPPTWVYGTATGTWNGTSRLHIYLSGAGSAYVDDVKLVAGSVPEAGANLLQNGDFESALTPAWTLNANFAGSQISPTTARSGNGSLRVVATGAGGTNNAIFQTISPGLTVGQTYTVSYWYVPATPAQTLTVRLSGNGGNVLVDSPDRDISGLNRRLREKEASLGDLRAWWCQRAVESPRQLFEVLSQFWENHFVTQQTKSDDYFENLGYSGTSANYLATDWEFREITKWRNAMLNPNCTFYDLLKISIESPAMIVYLDSVNSKGNNNNIANENYARELLELFTMGVDNGYDQNDIVLMSRAWTGWSVELVDEANANNPFAPASVTYYPGTNNANKYNIVGTWAFNFKQGNHGTNRGAIFGGKTVPARFGPPWAGMPYQITLPARGAVTNGIQDGYDVIASLANSPFTQEYISVKLCRLFVHDGFPNPTTHAEVPEYGFYDYTNPDRSPEAELVHQCMLAWENSSPKGNLRAVLATIFNSDLFRSHAAAGQKVKNPFEFVASSIRALRAGGTNGFPTAATDGYSFASPLDRMGTMLLFDRAAPDGYAEDSGPWISAGTLVERIRFIQSYNIPLGATGHNAGDAGNNVCDPVGLVTKKLPSNKWRDAGAVADYFLSILFPGEGAGNLTLYRSAAINYLNTNDSGASAPLASESSLAPGSNYDYRIRGMVSMLMAYQRFQEQ